MRYGRPSPSNGIAQITVALRVQGDEVVLSVSDNGPGLAAEQHERLLTRGSQGQDGEALGLGAGLGLSIVQRYADLLESRLTLQSRQGLCVSLALRRVHDVGPHAASTP